MELQVARRDAVTADEETTLALTGSLDLASRQVLVDAGLEVLGQGRSLALDLAEVGFIDSTAIGALVELANAAKRQGRSFAVTATSAPVRRILDVTGLADAWSPA
jgi:anti-anti-sigma factor